VLHRCSVVRLRASRYGETAFACDAR